MIIKSRNDYVRGQPRIIWICSSREKIQSLEKFSKNEIKHHETQFFYQNINVLGHNISAGGVCQLDTNLKAIREYPRLTTKKD